MKSTPDFGTAIEHLPEVRTYLNVVCSKIRSSDLKEQIEAEILSHIESHINDQKSLGIPFDQAVKAALSSLGDAGELRRDFFEANQPFYLRKIILPAYCSSFNISTDVYRYG